MTVSGNIKAEKVFELAEKWFGEIKRNMSPHALSRGTTTNRSPFTHRGT